MEAKILGTAAAEGIPALFCGCDACKTARALGGKNIRARQSLFLSPDILIDLGPDSMSSVHRYGLDFSQLAAILFTHSHTDHCAPDEIGHLHGPTFARDRTHERVLFYGNEQVRARIRETVEHVPEADVRPAVPFETFTVSDVTVTPIRSYHREPDDEETLNFLLTRGGNPLYATDLGRYDEKTWDYLAGVHLDAVIMECTFGVIPRNPEWPYHMAYGDVVEMKERMHAIGALSKDAPFIITHFSHNGVIPYDEFQTKADADGITVAWDGMNVSL